MVGLCRGGRGWKAMLLHLEAREVWDCSFGRKLDVVGLQGDHQMAVKFLQFHQIDFGVELISPAAGHKETT